MNVQRFGRCAFDMRPTQRLKSLLCKDVIVEVSPRAYTRMIKKKKVNLKARGGRGVKGGEAAFKLSLLVSETSSTHSHNYQSMNQLTISFVN